MSAKKQKSEIAIFEGKQIRRHWDDEKELKCLKQEGSELVTKCNQLKMRASDGKFYLTDAADTEAMLLLIQSIPSPNAEPFKHN